MQSIVSRLPFTWQIIGVLCCWAAAVVTGITSLVIYTGNRKPWYVVINLIINISGLGLTLLVLLLIGLLRMR